MSADTSVKGHLSSTLLCNLKTDNLEDFYTADLPQELPENPQLQTSCLVLARDHNTALACANEINDSENVTTECDNGYLEQFSHFDQPTATQCEQQENCAHATIVSPEQPTSMTFPNNVQSERQPCTTLPVVATVENEHKKTFSDQQLIDICLSSDCRVSIEQLKSSGALSDSYVSEDSDPGEELALFGKPNTALRYAESLISGCPEPTYSCEAAEFTGAETTKHICYNSPLVKCPKVYSDEMSLTAVNPLVTAISDETGDRVIRHSDENQIKESLSKCTIDLKPLSNMQNCNCANSSASGLCLVGSCKQSQMESICSTDESIKLLRRNSHAMKAKLKGAIESVRDKTSSEIRDAETKRFVNPSRSIGMKSTTRELRVLLRPLPQDKLITVSSSSKAKRDKRKMDSDGTSNALSDTDSDEGSEDPDYAPTASEPSSDDDQSHQVTSPKNFPNNSLNKEKKKSDTLPPQKLVGPKVSVYKVVSCTEPGETHNGVPCTSFKIVETEDISGNRYASTSAAQAAKNLNFPQNIVNTLQSSPSHISAQHFVEKSDTQNSESPNTNSCSSKEDMEVASPKQVEGDVESTLMNDPCHLPAFGVSEEVHSKQPFVSQKFLTDISLPSRSQSTSSNIDHSPPESGDLPHPDGRLSSNSSLAMSAFHVVNAGGQPRYSPKVVRPGCGEPLSLRMELRLVQLDGSPESSSTESEVELDLANSAHHSATSTRIVRASASNCPIRSTGTSARRTSLDDPEIVEAFRTSKEDDQEMIGALLLDEMANRVVCDSDHKTCEFTVGCGRKMYIYMTEAEKRNSYISSPVAKGFELNCQPDDETEIVRDLLYDMTNRVICQVEHTADKSGIRKCKPGVTCCWFKKFHKSNRPPTPILKKKKRRTKQKKSSAKPVRKAANHKEKIGGRRIPQLKTRKPKETAKSKGAACKISAREVENLLDNALLPPKEMNVRLTRSGQKHSTSRTRNLPRACTRSNVSSRSESEAEQVKSLLETEKTENSSEPDANSDTYLWYNYDDDKDDELEEILSSLHSTDATQSSASSAASLSFLESLYSADPPSAPSVQRSYSPPIAAPSHYTDLVSSTFNTNAHYQATALPYAEHSSQDTHWNNPVSNAYQNSSPITERSSCAYSLVECSQSAADGNLSLDPHYAIANEIDEESQRETNGKSSASNKPRTSSPRRARSQSLGRAMSRSPSCDSIAEEIPTMTMTEAMLQSIEGDRELITASLLEEMLNKIVCTASHKTCMYSDSCARGFYAYMTKGERQKFNSNNSVAKGFELHCQPDDETEIVRDLLYDMTNRVICQVEHTADKSGIRKCKPGTTCCWFKKFHRSNRPPTPVLETKRKHEKARSKSADGKKAKTPPAKGIKKQSIKMSNRKQMKGKLTGKRNSNGSFLTADTDTDNEKSSGGEGHESENEEAADKFKVIAKATTSTGRRSKRSAMTKSDGKANADTQGASMLPDLGVDVVLPDVSTDDCSTEPDSAGEIINRRQNLRRKKKRALPKEERDRLREQMIAQRRTTLKYMATPRSAVLAQLIQEEAQKQCTEILLPKNLPIYTPDSPTVRPSIFPTDLKLSHHKIASILNSVFTPDRTPAGFDPPTIINEMCEVQASGVVRDSELLYQLCMFISSSTTHPVSLHSLLQAVAENSHEEMKRCPLPACNSQVYDNWTQVGTHLLLHLPPVYHQLMSQAFRCQICWLGFPTPYHHSDHHEQQHQEQSYLPAVLTGFSSSLLNNLWSSTEFTNMLFIDWPISMASTKREAVKDYSLFRTQEPVTVVPPTVQDCCNSDSSSHCHGSSFQKPPVQSDITSISVDQSEDITKNSPCQSPKVVDPGSSPIANDEPQVIVSKEKQEDNTKPENDNQETVADSHLHNNDSIEDIHVDAGVEQTLIREHEHIPYPVGNSAENNEESEEVMENATDKVTSELLQQAIEEVPAPTAELTAYICWYCARPFIGRMSFYIHLLQESMAIPAAGILSGCVFADESEFTQCYQCQEAVDVCNIKEHLLSKHPTETGSDSVEDVERGYTEAPMSCPCDGCMQVFADCTALGDHLVCVHTPQNRRAMLKHNCTACGLVFPTYYHTKAHWDSNKKCFLESRADAVEPFVGHTLDAPYWTEDLLCSHDVTLTKHKKYTFCSTYKTSPHVMCFICHKLFYRDPGDLELYTLSKTVKNLQAELANHVAVCHQTILTSGLEIKPSRTDPATGLQYAGDLTDTDEEQVLNVSQQLTRVGSEHGNNDGQKQKASSKAIGAYTRCSMHLFRMSKMKDNDRYICRKCVNIRIWARSLNLASSYSYTLNGVGKKTYCKTHNDSLIAVHESTHALSYCVECSAEDHPHERTPCKWYCDTHGPWVSSAPCVRCKKVCKKFEETSIFDTVMTDSPTKENIESQLEEAGNTEETDKVPLPCPDLVIETVTPASSAVTTTGSNDKPPVNFTITEMAEEPSAGRETALAISFISELPNTVIDSQNDENKMKIEDGAAAFRVPSADGSSAKKPKERGKSKFKKENADVDDEHTVSAPKQIISIENHAYRISKTCSFHKNAGVYSCLVSGDDTSQRSDICRTCRLMPKVRSANDVVFVLKATKDLSCAFHPQSSIAKLKEPCDYYCTSCVKLSLRSEIFCVFHLTSNLHHLKKTGVVQGCHECVQAYKSLEKSDSSFPSRACCGTISCRMHPKSALTIDPTTAEVLFCNDCAAKGSPIYYCCPTHGTVERKYWKLNGLNRIVCCPVCLANLRIDAMTQPVKLKQAAEVTADDIAQCYALFNEADQGKVKPVVSGRVDPTSCKFVKDSAVAAVIPTECELQETGQSAALDNLDNTDDTPTQWRRSCIYCKHEWITMEEYESHMRIAHRAVHIPTIYRCEECPYVTTDGESLSSHTQMHGLDRNKADDISEENKSCPELAAGNVKESDFGNVSDTPTDCVEKNLETVDSLEKSPVKKSSAPRADKGKYPVFKHHCSECNYAHYRWSTFDKHVKLHSIKTAAQCDDCSYLGLNTSYVKTHKTAGSCGMFEKENTYKRAEQPKRKVHSKTDLKKGDEKGSSQLMGDMYPCTQCTYRAATSTLKDEHAQAHGNPSSLRCHQCDFLAINVASMRTHLLDCIGKSRVTATQSRTKETSNPAVDEVRQKSSWKQGHVYACFHCRHSLYTEASRYLHMKTTHPNTKLGHVYPCGLCFYVAGSHRLWTEHCKAHSNPSAVKCPSCHLLCSNQQVMNLHRTICQVKYDGYRTVEQADASGHSSEMGTKSRVSIINQRRLGLKKSNLARLKKGLRKWSDKTANAGTAGLVYKYLCMGCTQTFATEAEFLDHGKTRHAGGQVFHKLVCLRCPFAHIDPRAMKQHAMAHSLPKAYQCSSCFLLSPHTVVINSHLRKCKLKVAAADSVSEKPVMKVVAASVSKEPELKVAAAASASKELEGGRLSSFSASTWSDHQFQCSVCGYQVTGNQDYRLHIMKYHNGIHPRNLYLCKRCPFVTEQSLTFTNHIKRHDEPGTIKCPYCYHLGSNKCGLNRHIQFCIFKPENDGNVTKPGEEDNKELMKTTEDKESKKTTCKARKHQDLKMCEESIAQWGDHHLVCDMCDYSLKSQLDYRDHMKQNHPGRTVLKLFLCKECPFVAGSSHFKLHMRLHSLSTAIKCPFCPFLAESRHYLRPHLKKCAGNKSKELLDSKANKESKSLACKPKKCLDPRMYEESSSAQWVDHHLACDNCDYTFKSQLDYKDHLEQNHPEKRVLKLYLCDKCPFVSGSSRFKFHVQLHFLPSAVKCPFCPFLGKSLNYVKSHFEKCKGSVDGNSSKSRDEIIEELLKSKESKTTGCRQIKSPDPRMYEESIAQWGDHHLLCDICDYSFKSQLDYRDHIKQNHPDKKVLKLFLCEECPFVAGSSHFKLHTRLHSLSTAIKCPFCSFLGKSLNYVKSHFEKCKGSVDGNSSKSRDEIIEELLKSKESKTTGCRQIKSPDPRMYEESIAQWGDHHLLCDICDYSFKSQLDYGDHIKQNHPDKKVFKLFLCEECPFVAGSSHFKLHTRLHSLSTAIKCPFCSFLGKSLTYLKSHLEKCKGSVEENSSKSRDEIIEDLLKSKEMKATGCKQNKSAGEGSVDGKRNESKEGTAEELLKSNECKTLINKPRKCLEPKAYEESIADWGDRHLICEYCDYSLKSQLDHKDHMKQNHPDKLRRTLVLCQECPFVTDASNFITHKRMHSNSTAVKCPSCSYLGRSQGFVNAHLKKCKGGSNSTEQLKELILQKKKQTEDSERPAGEIQSSSADNNESESNAPEGTGESEWTSDAHHFFCRQCKKTIYSQKEYFIHMEKEHPQKQTKNVYLCEKCPYVTVSPVALKNHLERHSLSTAVQCPNCLLLTESKSFLDKHMSTCKRRKFSTIQDAQSVEKTECLTVAGHGDPTKVPAPSCQSKAASFSSDLLTAKDIALKLKKSSVKLKKLVADGLFSQKLKESHDSHSSTNVSAASSGQELNDVTDENKSNKNEDSSLTATVGSSASNPECSNNNELSLAKSPELPHSAGDTSSDVLTGAASLDDLVALLDIANMAEDDSTGISTVDDIDIGGDTTENAFLREEYKAVSATVQDFVQDLMKKTSQTNTGGDGPLVCDEPLGTKSETTSSGVLARSSSSSAEPMNLTLTDSSDSQLLSNQDIADQLQTDDKAVSSTTKDNTTRESVNPNTAGTHKQSISNEDETKGEDYGEKSHQSPLQSDCVKDGAEVPVTVEELELATDDSSSAIVSIPISIKEEADFTRHESLTRTIDMDTPEEPANPAGSTPYLNVTQQLQGMDNALSSDLGGLPKENESVPNFDSKSVSLVKTISDPTESGKSFVRFEWKAPVSHFAKSRSRSVDEGVEPIDMRCRVSDAPQSMPTITSSSTNKVSTPPPEHSTQPVRSTSESECETVSSTKSVKTVCKSKSQLSSSMKTVKHKSKSKIQDTSLTETVKDAPRSKRQITRQTEPTSKKQIVSAEGLEHTRKSRRQIASDMVHGASKSRRQTASSEAVDELPKSKRQTASSAKAVDELPKSKRRTASSSEAVDELPKSMRQTAPSTEAVDDLPKLESQAALSTEAREKTKLPLHQKDQKSKTQTAVSTKAVNELPKSKKPTASSSEAVDGLPKSMRQTAPSTEAIDDLLKLESQAALSTEAEEKTKLPLHQKDQKSKTQTASFTKAVNELPRSKRRTASSSGAVFELPKSMRQTAPSTEPVDDLPKLKSQAALSMEAEEKTRLPLHQKDQKSKTQTASSTKAVNELPKSKRQTASSSKAVDELPKSMRQTAPSTEAVDDLPKLESQAALSTEAEEKTKLPLHQKDQKSKTQTASSTKAVNELPKSKRRTASSSEAVNELPKSKRQTASSSQAIDDVSKCKNQTASVTKAADGAPKSKRRTTSSTKAVNVMTQSTQQTVPSIETVDGTLKSKRQTASSTQLVDGTPKSRKRTTSSIKASGDTTKSKRQTSHSSKGGNSLPKDSVTGCKESLIPTLQSKTEAELETAAEEDTSERRKSTRRKNPINRHGISEDVGMETGEKTGSDKVDSEETDAETNVSKSINTPPAQPSKRPMAKRTKLTKELLDSEHSANDPSIKTLTMSEPAADDLVSNTKIAAKETESPEKKKRKIRLDEYLKRDSKHSKKSPSNQSHGNKSHSNQSLNNQSHPNQISYAVATEIHEETTHGVYGVTTKLSPNTILNMKEKYLKMMDESSSDESETPTRAIEHVLGRHQFHGSLLHVPAATTSAGITPNVRDYDELALGCDICLDTIHGLKNILFHTEMHSNARCYCCMRRIDDLSYLHVHIATAHLHMEQADFERWRYITGKESDVLFNRNKTYSASVPGHATYARQNSSNKSYNHYPVFSASHVNETETPFAMPPKMYPEHQITNNFNEHHTLLSPTEETIAEPTLLSTTKEHMVQHTLLSPTEETIAGPTWLSLTKELTIQPTLLSSTKEHITQHTLLSPTEELSIKPTLLSPTKEHVTQPAVHSLAKETIVQPPMLSPTEETEVKHTLLSPSETSAQERILSPVREALTQGVTLSAENINQHAMLSPSEESLQHHTLPMLTIDSNTSQQIKNNDPSITEQRSSLSPVYVHQPYRNIPSYRTSRPVDHRQTPKYHASAPRYVTAERRDYSCDSRRSASSSWDQSLSRERNRDYTNCSSGDLDLRSSHITNTKWHSDDRDMDLRSSRSETTVRSKHNFTHTSPNKDIDLRQWNRKNHNVYGGRYSSHKDSVDRQTGTHSRGWSVDLDTKKLSSGDGHESRSERRSQSREQQTNTGSTSQMHRRDEMNRPYYNQYRSSPQRDDRRWTRDSFGDDERISNEDRPRLAESNFGKPDQSSHTSERSAHSTEPENHRGSSRSKRSRDSNSLSYRDRSERHQMSQEKHGHCDNKTEQSSNGNREVRSERCTKDTSERRERHSQREQRSKRRHDFVEDATKSQLHTDYKNDSKRHRSSNERSDEDSLSSRRSIHRSDGHSYSSSKSSESKRHSPHKSECRRRRQRYKDEEDDVVMTTHDGQLVRLKSGKSGELELA